MKYNTSPIKLYRNGGLCNTSNTQVVIGNGHSLSDYKAIAAGNTIDYSYTIPICNTQ